MRMNIDIYNIKGNPLSRTKVVREHSHIDTNKGLCIFIGGNVWTGSRVDTWPLGVEWNPLNGWWFAHPSTLRERPFQRWFPYRRVQIARVLTHVRGTHPSISRSMRAIYIFYLPVSMPRLSPNVGCAEAGSPGITFRDSSDNSGSPEWRRHLDGACRV